MITQKQPISAVRKNNLVYMDETQRFGDTHLGGLQHKAMACIDGNNKFVKLDELSPEVSGNWKPKFDFQYSSISESIVSCLIRNMKHDNNFESVDYQFDVFHLKNNNVTGTSSDNFLRENEVERVLSSTSQTHTAAKLNDYVANVIDVKVDKRIDNLVQFFKDQNVSEDVAKHFIIQQAGFDVLSGNTDRLNNPGNFTFAFNAKDKTCRPVNMDFGRCLPIPTWSTTAETNYDFDPEFYEEDVNDFAHNLIGNNDSICGSYNIKDSFKLLKEHGFEPFKINLTNLHHDLDELNEKIQNSNTECKKFAKMKIEAFKHMLTLPEIQPLWKDSSIALDLEDLDERGPSL